MAVNAIDARRQFIKFSGPQEIDPQNLGPDGKPFRGNLLDLHTLAYAFSDRNLSLNSAAKLFGCHERKQTEDVVYGMVDEKHIDYCRQDVRVTAELLDKLHDEYDRHPTTALLPATQLVSPAALGKAYLRAMGISPLVEREGDVSRDDLGKAMTAYLGGRVETMIRRVDLPCVYVDATSMYSSVFALTKLWRTITAAKLTKDDATAMAISFLADVSRDHLLDPDAWPSLAGVFCRVRPAGHLLPVRARFRESTSNDEDGGTGAFQIALTPFDSDGREVWYALADLAACRLLTRDAPEILEAFRVVPSGQIPLQSVKLRGELEIDPAGEDFFQRLIEARKRADASTPDGRRLDLFLKTVASAAAYGIFAEFRELPEVGGRGRAIDVWALRSFRIGGIHRPEEPGAFCYPPVAATVTACARLMLALLQAEVEAAGGRHIAGDTDALIIPATREGGLVACPGGDARLPDGTPAIRALSWAEVEGVRERLNRLNPYDRAAVPQLIKLEDENFRLIGHDEDGKPLVDKSDQIDLRCVAISPKRYTLWEKSPSGETIIRRASQHGLGLYLPPTRRPDFDVPDDAAKESWTEVIWRRIVDEIRGRDPGPEPEWFPSLAPSQDSITRWKLIEPYARLNHRRRYPRRVKPANFLLVAHDDPLVALPNGIDRAHLTPIAPFSRERLEWPQLRWRNRFDGNAVTLTTREGGDPGKVRVRTYGDVVTDYRLHPDPKTAERTGRPVRRGTVGVLTRRPVLATGIRYVGKETARRIEEEAGMLRLSDEPFTEYRDDGEEWSELIDRLVALRDTGALTVREIAAAANRSERSVQYWLNGGKMPRNAEVVVRLRELVRP